MQTWMETQAGSSFYTGTRKQHIDRVLNSQCLRMCARQKQPYYRAPLRVLQFGQPGRSQAKASIAG